jgi:hypothetical protein
MLLLGTLVSTLYRLASKHGHETGGVSKGSAISIPIHLGANRLRQVPSSSMNKALQMTSIRVRPQAFESGYRPPLPFQLTPVAHGEGDLKQPSPPDRRG